jgi:hypothetical protein
MQAPLSVLERNDGSERPQATDDGLPATVKGSRIRMAYALTQRGDARIAIGALKARCGRHRREANEEYEFRLGQALSENWAIGRPLYANVYFRSRPLPAAQPPEVLAVKRSLAALFKGHCVILITREK